MKNLIWLACLLLLGVNTFAQDNSIGPVTVESVGIISDWATHKPGSLEIKVKGGFTLPNDISCTDSNYLTTLNSVESFPYLFAALITAQSKGQPVYLGITDDPSRNAYSTRCSLKTVTLLPMP